ELAFDTGPPFLGLLELAFDTGAGFFGRLELGLQRGDSRDRVVEMLDHADVFTPLHVEILVQRLDLGLRVLQTRAQCLLRGERTAALGRALARFVARNARRLARAVELLAELGQLVADVTRVVFGCLARNRDRVELRTSVLELGMPALGASVGELLRALVEL